MQKKTDFALDLHQVAEIWRHGSVVRSWLLDLIARALEENPTLDGIAPLGPSIPVDPAWGAVHPRPPGYARAYRASYANT